MKRNLTKLIIFVILSALVLGLSSCVPKDPGSTGSEPSDVPEVTIEIPDITPASVDLPDSYDYYDVAIATKKSKAAKYFNNLRKNVFIKLDRCYGFCGNVSFEYVGGSPAYVPVEIGGIVYAPLSGLAKAFGADYREESGFIVLTYIGIDARISLNDCTVTYDGATHPFRKPEQIGGIYYGDASNVALLFNYFTEKTEDILHMVPIEKNEKDSLEDAKALFDTYDQSIYTDKKIECDKTGAGLYPPTDPSERLVGIAYTTWFRSDRKWGEGHTWDLPWLGVYTSTDRNVIKQHGIWLRDAGVDFVFVDWSNNVNYDPATMRTKRADFRTIEDATEALFDVWADIPGAPKICIFTGPGHEQGSGEKDTLANGRMAAKTQQIYDTYIANERYRNMYFEYEGKPLLLCYAATPAFFQDNVSPYEDDRFTVRWITGFVGQQGNLFDRDTLVSKIFWSWEERGAQTFTVLNGRPECMTVNAAYRGQGKNPGTKGYIAPALRENGDTFRRAWARARLIGPKIVLVVSFNEWTLGEQISFENSKDIEPSEKLGSFYLDLMREEIRRFKS